MKICHIFPTLLLLDGPTNFVSNLAGQLRDRGVDSTVISLRHPPAARSAAAQITGRGARYLELGMRQGIWDPASIFRLANLLKNEKPDIVQCNLFRGNVYGTIAAKLAGVSKVICVGHNQEEYMTGRGFQATLARVAERMAANSADMYVAVSQAVADTVARQMSISRIRVIHVGLDPIGKECTRVEARTRLGIPNNAFVLGSVGRLHRQKGYTDLLQVAARVLPEIPNLHVVIIGEGPERGRLEALARHLGIVGRVSMPGLVRSEISELLPAFDIFIMTSIYEGIPATLAESMRSGLPSVVTDAGGVREMVRNGLTGIMTQPGDCDSLSEAVVTLARDAELRAAMGSRARELFREILTSSAMADRYLNLYAELCSSGQGANALRAWSPGNKGESSRGAATEP